MFDVIVVGYGPVGRMLSLKLGRRGHKVLVLERQPATYPLPRAVHHDDEIGRVFQSIGLPPSSIPDATEPYDDFYEWRNADRDTLVRLDWRGHGPSGWNVSNFFHQPTLEMKIHHLVTETESVDLRWGHSVTGRMEHEDSVELQVEDEKGDPYTVEGRFVIGADGAKSKVRSWIGEEYEDLGYFRDWLVIDLLPSAPIPIDPPAWQLCDPLRPTTLVPGGPGRRRWEFMRLPDEDPVEFASVENAWKLMEPWGVTHETAELERHALYTFQARWAESWRAGRLLLCGDSAHLMPPFAGQGMCSGLRDAVNLEWKLDLVLRGAADQALLDSYGPERSEHVRDFIEFSMELGNVICISDPAQAAERDKTMKADLAAGIVPPPRPLPRLGAGVHRSTGIGGTLAIQAVVRGEAGEGLFDDIVGSAGALIGPAHVIKNVDPGRRKALADIGITVIALGEEVGPGAVVDVDGAYGTWLAEHNTDAVLVRPDFYAYGGTQPGEPVDVLIDEYLSRVTRRAVTVG